MMKGRKETSARRREQAETVASFVNKQWKAAKFTGNFVVCGDLNDFVDDETSLTALTSHEGLVNVLRRLPEENQWTHYFTGLTEYKQLDYLLLSKGLAETAENKATLPVVVRNGLPERAARYKGVRYPGVGIDRPKASDHCPLYMDIALLPPRPCGGV